MDINEIVIDLIPKVDDPKVMTLFWPISLCIVLSVFNSQNKGFFHYLQSSKNGSNKGFVIKFNMIKAYDRVEWEFLEKVMIFMGFSASCVTFFYVVRLYCELRC